MAGAKEADPGGAVAGLADLHDAAIADLPNQRVQCLDNMAHRIRRDGRMAPCAIATGWPAEAQGRR